ncbi:unnamed protein product [Orchesella dallaii]
MIMKKLCTWKKQELLPCRLVNSNWKGVADIILERSFISKLTEWDPTEREPETTWEDGEPVDDEDNEDPNTGAIWLDAMYAGVPRLRAIWSENDSTIDLIPNFDHPFPNTHNDKLGTSLPTNCLRIKFHNKVWPDKQRFGMSKRAQMFTEFVVKYEHSFSFLKVLLLTDIHISPSNLATVLGKLSNLKALKLEDTVLAVEPGDLKNEEENSFFPPLPNLTHLRVVSTDNKASQFLLKAYHKQLICLETSSRVPFFSKPYGNLKRLKLITDLKPDAQFPQGEENPFPALKFLSISTHCGHVYEWDEISQSIDGFPRTLIDLHLEIHQRLKTKDEVIQQLASSGVTLPNIKTLGIFLPTSSQHADCFHRLILPKFPNLQRINLIDDRYWYYEHQLMSGSSEVVNAGFETTYEATKLDRMNVEKMVQGLQFYTTVCPKLKSVEVIKFEI